MPSMGPDSSPSSLSSRVLLVDPSRPIRSRLRDQMTRAHLEVREAGDLAAAEQALSSFRPDAILVQLRPGAESGLELLGRLKANPEARSIPVILYGRAATAEERIRAFDLDAADLLSPPLAGAELIARVRAALRGRHVMAALERLAYRDGLTGLLNRAALEDQLRREWADLRRHGTSLSVLIVDLDNFKEINDTYGHAAGDEVLRRTAEVLTRSVRASDLVARYGGDEFVVVAPGCPPDSAVLLASRFHAGLAGSPIFAPGSSLPIAIIASVGIAGAAGPTPGSPLELLEQADQALYHVKRTGGDAVAIYEPSKSAPVLGGGFRSDSRCGVETGPRRRPGGAGRRARFD